MHGLIVGPAAPISTHAPAGGATYEHKQHRRAENISTHAPAGGATNAGHQIANGTLNFYSRPCGRGDFVWTVAPSFFNAFLLTPLREGRPISSISTACPLFLFLLTPLREGRPS